MVTNESVKRRLEQAWRWYGPHTDTVTLQDVKQAGATAIVSALHHIPHGEVWPVAEIADRNQQISNAGLRWSVVESVPVHEAIKTRRPDATVYLDNYRQSVRNLAQQGLTTICYNFMPVLDWTRTQLDWPLPHGAKALYFNWTELAVFDRYILNREEADNDYPAHILQQAHARHSNMTQVQRDNLAGIILMGVPTEKGITLDALRRSIAEYTEIGRDGLSENLAYFLRSIADTCEEHGVKLTIHPDDPPYAILGLPRIASSKQDMLRVLQHVDRPFNGICFCTGSLGAGAHNDVVDILEAVKHRVYFAHLRNIRKDQDGNFYESDHLDGDVDMYQVMRILATENQQRDQPIPFRPDHGHQMLDDLHKTTNPGYSAIGRLRGLAELRGLELGVLRNNGYPIISEHH